MPAFFIAYDARFRPQDHLLTLDYPTVNIHREMCGIDVIYQYLCDIVVEKNFLECFAKAVREGYQGFTASGGFDEYEALSEEKRWDDELYQSVLRELFWE